MDRFHRLLVYLPFGQPVEVVIKTADELARRNDATVTLVDVIESGSGRTRKSSADLDRALAAASAARLGDAAGLFKHVEPEVVVRHGVDFIEVINQVYDGHHDMVLVGSQPRAEPSARLDPTLAHLLRKTPVPVWVVDENHRSGDVMVAIGPEFEPEGRVLNRTILELGTSLARRMTVGCHVVHAWRVPGESLLLGSRVQIPEDQVDRLMDDTESTADAMIAQLTSEVPTVADAEVHLVHGRPEAQLMGLVEKIEPSVLVMGTLARKGIAGLIVGNTAERVLTSIDASLLAVKPPWFVSPVPPPAGHTTMVLD